MTTETRTSYEPPPALGVITAAIAISGAVLAAVSLIAMVMPPVWLTGANRLLPLPLVAFGWLLFVRFTRDDRNIAGTIADLNLDIEDALDEIERLEQITGIISEHVETIEFLRELLSKPSKTLTINDRDGQRIVPMYERDDTWRRAMAIVRSALEDFGKLRGHDVLGHTQDEQTSALKLLKHLGIAAPRGTIWRLTVSRQQAADQLNAFAIEGNRRSTPPDSPRQDANPEDFTSRQEVASGFASGFVAAGEVAQ